MFRTIIMGVVALVAVLAVLGMVFAVGALRIRLSDDGSADVAASNPDPPAATQPSTLAELPAQDTPAEAIPAIDFQTVELPAEKAKLSPGLILQADRIAASRGHAGGKGRKGRVGPPDAPVQPPQEIVGWRTEQDSAEWVVTLPKQGVYEVDIVCASIFSRAAGFSYVITLADQELKEQAETGSRGGSSYKMLTAGIVTLPAGEIHVRFHPSVQLPSAYLRLQSIRLIPAS